MTTIDQLDQLENQLSQSHIWQIRTQCKGLSINEYIAALESEVQASREAIESARRWLAENSGQSVTPGGIQRGSGRRIPRQSVVLTPPPSVGVKTGVF